MKPTHILVRKKDSPAFKAGKIYPAVKENTLYRVTNDMGGEARVGGARPFWEAVYLIEENWAPIEGATHWALNTNCKSLKRGHVFPAREEKNGRFKLRANRAYLNESAWEILGPIQNPERTAKPAKEPVPKHKRLYTPTYVMIRLEKTSAQFTPGGLYYGVIDAGDFRALDDNGDWILTLDSAWKMFRIGTSKNVAVKNPTHWLKRKKTHDGFYGGDVYPARSEKGTDKHVINDGVFTNIAYPISWEPIGEIPDVMREYDAKLREAAPVEKETSNTKTNDDQFWQAAAQESRLYRKGQNPDLDVHVIQAPRCTGKTNFGDFGSAKEREGKRMFGTPFTPDNPFYARANELRTRHREQMEWYSSLLAKKIIQFNPEPTTKEPEPMKIETVTMINDQRATSFSDDALLSMIKKLEQDVEALKAVKTKSKKVSKMIDEHQAHIDQLVEILDAR